MHMCIILIHSAYILDSTMFELPSVDMLAYYNTNSFQTATFLPRAKY